MGVVIGIGDVGVERLGIEDDGLELVLAHLIDLERIPVDEPGVVSSDQLLLEGKALRVGPGGVRRRRRIDVGDIVGFGRVGVILEGFA